MELHGSCMCGAVHFVVTCSPVLMYHCHCGTCRKASGASFATNLIVPKDCFRIDAGQALLAGFESSPNKRRYFCSSCGSPIYSQADRTKDFVSIRSGTLDGDPEQRPSVHVYVGERAPWTAMPEDLPCRVGPLT